MLDIKILPKNWKEKAKKCPEIIAEEFRKLGEGVWIDDNCPAQLSIIVVEKNLNVFRLTDPAIIYLVASFSGVHASLIKIYNNFFLSPKSTNQNPSLN